jgi:branched-chain amino acid transport system substrate-binding protein
MRLFKRLSLILVAALSLTIAGCSSEIKLGAVISESGSVATYGEFVKKGMDLALEETNASGGTLGKKVSIVYRDDATNASVGQKVTKELIEIEKVNAIIGAVSSQVTLAIAPICEESKMVLLSPSASANSITDAGLWIWRNYPSDQIEGTAMAKFAKEEIGAERVVIFAHDNDWGNGLADVFTERYEGRFRTVEKRFVFDESMMGQADSWVAETMTMKPDAVYVIGYDHELKALLTAFQSASLQAAIMSTSSVTPSIGRQAGVAAENMVYPQAVLDLDSEEPAIAAFISSYRAKYNEDPDIYAAHGYDAVKIILAAMESAQATHPRSVNSAMMGIENFQGAAGTTSFNSDGDVVRYPRIFIVRDGEPMPYDELKDQGGSLFDR